MPRPTKLTPEIENVIIDSVSMGNFIETACAVAGIHKDTLYHWLKLAEERPKSVYGQFRDKLRKAQAEAESDAVTLITSAGTTQWQALAWRLERMYPEKWGNRLKVDSKSEHSGPNGGPIESRHVVEIEFVDADEGKPARSSGDETDKGAVPEQT